jgi:hypothetical protein
MMFHVKHFLTLLYFLPFGLFAQGTMELQDKQIVVQLARQLQIDSFLNTSELYTKLAKEEKDLFYWVNLLRFNPALFKKEVVEPFLHQFPESVSPYSKSLLDELLLQKPLPLVMPDQHLVNLCLGHAKDLANKQQKLSHSSSSGKSFQERMQEASITRCAAENIFDGKKDALQAILLLLIDQGVPGTGHRKALLNPAFDLMGVAFIPKKSGANFIMVQLFSCK